MKPPDRGLSILEHDDAVNAGCWHRPRTDGFVFFKQEDTAVGRGLRLCELGLGSSHDVMTRLHEPLGTEDGGQLRLQDLERPRRDRR